ncbi:F-box protein SKIP24 [Argentina anserina]|uniref:F-box protein SKIP24 n=1 Tax=Argentina anserina TaxID=57926 RepID=UPI00217647CA|nr:F-box protein SKIP24 [Potentilla anserina]
MMAILPDELWRRVLEIGGFSYKELCCISMTCRRLHRLSDEDLLWSHLISSDFAPPHPSSSSASFKSLYRLRYERDRNKRRAAHQRALLRKESQIIEHSRKLRDLETQLTQETQKRRATLVELSNFHKVREASLALNVWQPEIIRGRHKQTVEQCVVPSESRLHALEMELRLCTQQISGLEKVYKVEKQRLGLAEEELQSMRYHPLQDHKPVQPLSSGDAQCTSKRKKVEKI